MAGFPFERRTHQRADLPAFAVLVRGGADAGRFLVQNLSAAGALLTGGACVRVGESVLVRIEVQGHAPVVVGARVVRHVTTSDVTALALEFRHRSPDTEDAIHEAVLAALEAAESSRPFFKDVEHYAT